MSLQFLLGGESTEAVFRPYISMYHVNGVLFYSVNNQLCTEHDQPNGASLNEEGRPLDFDLTSVLHDVLS